MPPEMAATQYAQRDVVGDLGGVPVTIPRHFANFVEYEGDPGWGEKRKGSVPVRTHQSKLTSFGYYTRFSDMAGRSSPELRKDSESYFSGKTPWISVGINTGSMYPGDGFLDRVTTAKIGKIEHILKYEQYEQLPGQQHGLTVYAAAGSTLKRIRHTAKIPMPTISLCIATKLIGWIRTLTVATVMFSRHHAGTTSVWSHTCTRKLM